jgi:CHAT domain-containing protein
MHKKVFQNASLSDDDSPQDDGQIHAYELFPLHMKSDMVMLSSCESGTGSYITGSGLIGLNRAFTYAGVKSLVMNMWKVDDKAAETVSVQFYKYLKQGLPKDEALRKAKLYYLNNVDSDPLKWGSYIVTGKISPLFHPIWDLATIATRFLIVLIVIVAGYVTYRFNKS